MRAVGSIVAIFIVATFLASGALLVIQPLTYIDPNVLSLVQFGPTVGAVIALLVFRSRLSRLLPVSISRVPFMGCILLALLACALYAGLVAVFALWTGWSPSGASGVGNVPFVVILVVQFVGAMGEEIGWRGVLQPVLEQQMRRIFAAIATGIVWAVWHVQIFAAGSATAATFIAMTTVLAILMGYLGNGSFWQRVVTASIIHWLVNITLYVLAGDHTDDWHVMRISGAAIAITTALFIGTLVTIQRSSRHVVSAFDCVRS